MPAFIVAFDTKLRPDQLAAKRRRLGALLREQGLELRTLAMGEGKSIVQRLADEARGAPVIVLDDQHPEPGKSPRVQQLTSLASERMAQHRPNLIYVTEQPTSAGHAQLLGHPVLRYYLKRDAKGSWVNEAAELAGRIAREMKAIAPPSPATSTAEEAEEIVGVSRCFREAVEELGRIIRMPYGMVSGEAGVGKMRLIQALWRRVDATETPVVLPCGSFFKDYYVGGRCRRFGGGREAVDELTPYLDEADGGLLVLHHVERLPSSLQEELVARLSYATCKDMKNPVVGVDHALAEHDLRILATSTHSPQELRDRGLIPELAVKFAKRHVHIPSLAERGPADVELVCQDILRRIVRRQCGDGQDWKKLVPGFDPAAMQILRRAKTPDNISDLLRWVEYAWRHCKGGTIRRCHLPPDIAIGRPRPAGTLDQILAETERTAIQNALDQTGNDVAAAASILGRNKGTLHRRINFLGMKQRTGDQ